MRSAAVCRFDNETLGSSEKQMPFYLVLKFQITNKQMAYITNTYSPTQSLSERGKSKQLNCAISPVLHWFLHWHCTESPVLQFYAALTLHWKSSATIYYCTDTPVFWLTAALQCQCLHWPCLCFNRKHFFKFENCLGSRSALTSMSTAAFI